MDNRASFMAKIHGIMNDEEARDVELAYLLAKTLHKDQVRKELGPDFKPLRYFEHLRRVAIILVDVAGIHSCEAILTAILHDTIEDVEEIQLTCLLIERLFGKQILVNVRALSKVPKAGYIDRLKLAIKDNPIPILVKAADRLDNLRSLPKDNSEFASKQIKETKEIFLPIFSSASMPENFKPGFDLMIKEIINLA